MENGRGQECVLSFFLMHERFAPKAYVIRKVANESKGVTSLIKSSARIDSYLSVSPSWSRSFRICSDTIFETSVQCIRPGLESV